MEPLPVHTPFYTHLVLIYSRCAPPMTYIYSNYTAALTHLPTYIVELLLWLPAQPAVLSVLQTTAEPNIG